MGVLMYSVLVLTLICQSHSYNVKNPLDRFKRFEETAWSDPNDCSQTRQPVVMSNSNNFSVDIRMPGVLPKVSDTYFCVAAPVPTSREAYVVDFVPHASMDTAHHMLLYGCRTPYSTKGYWDCGTERGTCMDEAKIMYAWARNAPHTKLPKDVGFRVGGDSKITYFVLQIHYGDINNFRDHHRDCSGLTLRMTSKPQPFIAGMYLMVAVDTVVLPGKTVTNADIACTYSSYPMYPFAFRTHTHRLGKVVSGYRVRNGEWTLIGRQSPQLPQAFYPASNAIDVRIGDTLAARCVFTGEGKTTPTRIGGTANDEMCNFYFMYYMDNKQATPYMYCMNHGSSSLFRNIPAEANVPIAVSPDHMMTMMHGSSNNDGDADKQPTMKDEEEEAINEGTHLVEMTGWPKAELQLGQVSGLALDSNENLVIFHRGDHVWGIDSFDRNAIYQQISLGPIQQSTILVVDPIKGNVLKAFGRNMFFLPHGITTDKDNNYWVTDIALHQVLKLRNDGNPLLTLGEAFVPGSDKNHFCQPTDVAVDPDTGNVYVADGYCNSKILKFSPEGKYLYHWGAGSLDRRKRLPFYVPHSLAFAADKRELLVADRENGRVQCFMADTGEFVKEIKKDEFGGEVFAVSYAPVQGGIIYVVNGRSIYDQSIPVQGFALNYSTKEILDTFAPDTQEFKMPHDIVVAKDGSVFVSDVDLDMVVKFVPSEKAEHRSVKKGGFEVQEIEEMETFMQANLKPSNKQVVHSAAATVPKVPPATEKEHNPVHLPKTLDVNDKEKENENEKKSGQSQGPSPAVITTLLLLLPLVLIIAVGVFIRWKKRRMYGDGHEVKLEPSGSSGGILGKLRGKAAGTLNLGNFFATHKGYTRQGFDRLSTEGSDLEKDDEDATDSENEEYSAPLPPISSS